MFGQELGSSFLIFPGESASIVAGKFNVVGRIRINKIVLLNWQGCDIQVRESPLSQGLLIPVKIPWVIDGAVAAKWHIEFAATIETAESVKAGAIQIVKQLRSFRSFLLPLFDQFIKSV